MRVVIVEGQERIRIFEGRKKVVFRERIRIADYNGHAQTYTGYFKPQGWYETKHNTIVVVKQDRFLLNIRIFIHEFLHYINFLMWTNEAVDDWIDKQRFL